MAKPPLETIGGGQRKVSNTPPSFPIDPKEEPIEIHESLPLFQEYQISASELMKDEKFFKEEEMDNENMERIFANSPFIYSDSLNGAQNSEMDDRFGNLLNYPPFTDHNYARIMKRRSSGNDDSVTVSNKVLVLKENDTELECPECKAGLALLCECGSETLSSIHSLMCHQGNHITVIRKRDGPIRRLYDEKKRSTSRNYESVTVSKKFRLSKKNETELECPECEFCTRSVMSWVVHLRDLHSTKPELAGLALLCECGNESVSDAHSRMCDGNITVILKGNPTWQRGDEKATPQCVLCEAYPRTACGYALHLNFHHNSTLIQNGIYLICSCGLEVRYYDAYFKHPQKCDRRQFTLHKLADE